MLADTAYFIDLMRADPGAVKKRRELLERREPLVAGAVTLHELYLGAALYARPDEERVRVQAGLRAVPTIYYSGAMARLGGETEGQLQRRGLTLDRADIMIGVTARVLKTKVLTRNLRDFSRIEGLGVETY